jgi:gamma-glutamyltranspeptidase / glutathione hydrolase
VSRDGKIWPLCRGVLTRMGDSHRVRFVMKIQTWRLWIGSLLVLIPAALYAQAPEAQQPREFKTPPETSHAAWPTTPVRAAKGMVVSDEKLASEAGVEILKEGGNAVDAAVAVAFALAVVEPEAGNIGGGGFMLVRLADGSAKFIDYREVAPAGAKRDMYLDADGALEPEGSVIGYRAAGVPGTVAGLALALKMHGTKRLADVMAPAIELAEKGFPVSERLSELLSESGSVLGRFATSRRIFLKGGSLYEPGEILRQPELAATLRRIAKNGATEFYRGQTAHDLAREIQREGGILTLDDLEHYQAKVREPLTASYKVNGHDWEVISSPPPSSGGVAMIEALNILAPVELKSWDDPRSVHWVIEAMRRVFADRAAYLADPDFASIPVRGLTSLCYAEALRRGIDPALASTSQKIQAGDPAPYEKTEPTAGGCPGVASRAAASENDAAAERALAEAKHGGHTTHFSVVDAAGDAVANTYTINDNFGSGVTSMDGFLLNNEMDDFTTRVGSPNMFGLLQSAANAVGPGKRPLSSMAPTILLRDGKLSFVTGSPGGPTIISATLLTILNWMRLDMNAQAAINAPRFHHQWLPDEVLLEPNFPDSVAKELEERGFSVESKRRKIGQVEAIGIDPATGERLGAPDPRRSGAAASY